MSARPSVTRSAPPVPGKVIVNAISPAFENMFASAEDFAGRQTEPRRLCQHAVPRTGRAGGGDGAHQSQDRNWMSFSSMRAYQASDGQVSNRCTRSWHAIRASSHSPGVGQAELAARFRGAAFLVYPSTFIETYCIVAQEALAAGLKVISNDFGALPETTMGYADLFPVANGTIPSRQLCRGIIGAAGQKTDPCSCKARKEWAQRRFAQVQAVNRFGDSGRRRNGKALLASPLRN